MDNAGSQRLADNATLAIWEREDGYYYLIDVEGGERQEEIGPFETVREAEEDAHAWWAAQHVDEDPFMQDDEESIT